MNDKLQMYNFPCRTICNIKDFISKTFEHKLWVKCLAEFLTEINFFKKADDAHAEETIENTWQ